MMAPCWACIRCLVRQRSRAKQVVVCVTRQPEAYQCSGANPCGARLHRISALSSTIRTWFLSVRCATLLPFAYGLHLAEENVQLEQLLALSSPIVNRVYIPLAQKTRKSVCGHYYVVGAAIWRLSSCYYKPLRDSGFIGTGYASFWPDSFRKVEHGWRYARRFQNEPCVIARQANDTTIMMSLYSCRACCFASGEPVGDWLPRTFYLDYVGTYQNAPHGAGI